MGVNNDKPDNFNMTFIKRYVICIILHLPLLAIGQNLPQNQIYNVANEVSLKIFGIDRNYNFISEKFAGRYDKNQRFFEFILPIQSVFPIDGTHDVSIVRDLFVINKGQPVINLTVSFMDPLVSLEEFNSPQELILDGWLTIADRKYNIPVVMSLYYSNEVLFYKLRTEIDMYKLSWNMPEHYRTFLTGIMQIQVNDGKWRDFQTHLR